MHTQSPPEPKAQERIPSIHGGRHAPLAMDGEEFRRLGHEMVDLLSDFLDSVPDRPVARGETPGTVRAVLDAGRTLPEEGGNAGELLRAASGLLFDHSLFNGHPRFFGYISGSPAPVGMLADFLASAVNANVGAWRLAPMAAEIEEQAVRWIAELVGYPARSGGLFVSGGNMANFVALLAARVAAAGWDVRRVGLNVPVARPLRIYASRETHTWVEKAADLSGLGTDAIRWIATGADLRMDVRALRETMELDRKAGEKALMVVGTAGSVSTGAVDPLFEIAEICRETGAWFHVDGAYGAFAAAVPDTPRDLQAIRLADSVALDPHKWLYAPLEVGCVLVRDPSTLREAFTYRPPYFHFGEEVTNHVDLGPQNSRGFRALKVWLALQQAGRQGYVRMIGDDIGLSRRLHAAVADHPELEAVTQELSISTFRYVPRDLRDEVGTVGAEAYLNELNEALLERIQLSGETFVSHAVIRGRFVLRACIVNMRTGPADVDAVPGIVVRLGRQVDAALRAPLAAVIR